MFFHSDFPQNSSLHCMLEGWILKGRSCAIANVQSVIVVSWIYYINTLYMYIKNIHVQIHIYIHMYTYIRTYTYTYTLVTFSAEIVLFRRWILRFPEFHNVTLFTAVSLFRDNRETIFSHKIHLNLFQKQYNSLIEKVF